MPTPDISLLDADHLKDYQWAIQNFPNTDPAEIYAPLYADQQATIEAQQALQKQGEINDALKDGRMKDVPQEVQDVFQPPDGSRLSSPFKAMVPGFDPVIPPVERQLPATSIQAIRDGRSLYDPQNRNKAELEATQTAAQYYLNQGYPSFETAQNSSISNFLATYGDKEDFTNNNPLGLALTPNELQARWDTMYAVAKDPPSGFLQTAEQKGFEDIQGQMDRSVPGSLWNPSQPRRYAEWGDMEKVMPRGEGITELGQGASGVAEDFRRQPDLVREMSTRTLFTEAVRPQVIKSGEQVRRERDKAQQIRSRVLGGVQEIMDETKATEKEAFEKITEQYLEQAKITIRKEMIPRITFEMQKNYRLTSPKSLLTASVDEVHTQMVNDEAKAQVLNFYREAELYDYALEHTDLLKGPGTYYTRAGSALYDAYKYVAEDEQGDEFTQMRKKAGRIDKDAITEGTTMQYARNLNLPFRMIYNPLFDVAGETTDLVQQITGGDEEKAMRTGMSEVKFADKYGQTISSPTLDLTDETSWENPLTVLDAYFKEVLLETAVGRTVGNDVVSFMPTEYYDYMQENATNPNDIPFWGDPDTFVIAGTLAEVMMPIELIPIALSKGLSGLTRMPANWKTYAKVAQEIQKAGGVADPTKYGSLRTSLMNNSSVAAHAADDAADVILGLERVADGVVDARLATQGLSQRAKTITEIAMQSDEPAKAATKRIAEIAGDEKTYPVLSIAAKDSQARGAASTSRATKRTGKPRDKLDVVAETLAHQSMKGKVAARLEGEVGLGDYHLLTDRVAVSKQFLDEHPIDDLVTTVHNQLGKLQPRPNPRVIKDDYFKGTGTPVAPGMYTKSAEDGKDIAVNYGRLFQTDRAQDPFLDAIITSVKQGEPITYAQDVYLRQRVLEKVAMLEDEGMGLIKPSQRAVPEGKIEEIFGVPSNILPIEEGTDFAKMTQVPSERRLDTARAIRSLTPRDVRDALQEAKIKLTSGMKKSDLQNLGKADDPRIIALQNTANEAQVSLQRQIPLVAAKLNKKDGFTDGEVVDIMFDSALKGKDPTELLTLPKVNTVDGSINITPPGMIIDADPAQIQAFYSQLLGPSLDLPANRLAFQQSGALINGLDNAGIYKTLEEMQAIIPGALDTAAVSARQRKGLVAIADVDITGAKIAYATDKARKIRLDKVFQESGFQLSIDLAEQAKIMKAPGKEVQIAAALDEIAAAKAFGKPLDNADYERLYTSIYDKPYRARGNNTAQNTFTKIDEKAEQMANYIKGKRVAGTTAGYRADTIEEVFTQQLRLMVQGDKGIMSTPEGQAQIAAIFADIQGAKKGVAKNMTRLRRPIDRGALATASDLWDYTFNIKGRLVSGQLGGQALPNTIYHSQNIITAPLIASITAPEYVGAILDQQIRMVAKMATGKSPSVADDVMRAGAEPVMGPQGLGRFVTKTMDDGSQYIGKYSAEEAMDLYRTKNLGSTQEAMWLDDAFVNEVRKQAQGRGIPQRMLDDIIRDIPGSKVITGTPATERKGQQSVGMLLADSTDRAFREAVFFEALKRGKTGDEAAQLAREVLLDFGGMPGVAQETLGKAFLYMSFTYMMGQETLLALADPKKYRVLVSQLNYHRKLSEDLAGSGQTEMSDKVLKWRMDTSANGDAYAVFINNPVVGSFAQVAEITEAMRTQSYTYLVGSQKRYKELAQEPQVMEAGLSGLLDIGYNPFLDMLKTVQMEYKKPLPNKVVYQISALERTGILAGADAKDFFDLEYVPIEKRRIGKAEVGVDRYTIDPTTLERKKMTIDEVEAAELGGYQLRFKTERGYQKFVAMQQLLQFTGYGRLLNDTTGAAIAAGFLPEGTTYGYDEKSRLIFQLAGGKTMRVPKDWEKYDRQVRQYERDLMEFLKGYE